jgi:hypothetical protein
MGEFGFDNTGLLVVNNLCDRLRFTSTAASHLLDREKIDLVGVQRVC